MTRPVIYVLAGVNGAGKSSIGGYLLTQAGVTWFNPDTFARELVAEFGYGHGDANIAAWGEGVRRLNDAVAAGKSFAFETTLGGRTIVRRLIAASVSHDILVWFCSLKDAEQHIERVKFRVTQGGHDIPETKIRERWRTSMENLLLLLSHVSHLRAYENSAQVGLGEVVPEPRLVLHVETRQCRFPNTREALMDTPDWAKPLVEASINQAAGAKGGRARIGGEEAGPPGGVNR